MIYCVVPRELASQLHDRLRRHFRDDPQVEVIVERRTGDRRGRSDRRSRRAVAAPEGERRRVRARSGRRVGERRAEHVAIRSLELPRSLRRHADRLTFVERVLPSERAVEDTDTARLVARVQGGDTEAFADIYMRYFDRVYGYLRLALRNQEEARDATQHVFLNVLEALPTYERRRQPFRAWVFRIARNHAIDRLRERHRIEVEEPARLEELHDPRAGGRLRAVDWMSDQEMLRVIERLPLAQRQVLVLRYMMDLSTADIAEILDRSQQSVRQLQSRALRRLQENLVVGAGDGPAASRKRRLPIMRFRPPMRRLAHGFSARSDR
jgi:RNA polymerase sigma-70 factor (ECF subfamily)